MCGICESKLEQKFHTAWLNHPISKQYHIEPQVIISVQSQKVKTRRIDFGFRDIKLGVEIDSKQYHSTKQQRSNDKEREKELKRQGWSLIHLEGKLVYHQPEIAANKVILQYLKKVKKKNMFDYIGIIFDFILEWIVK